MIRPIRDAVENLAHTIDLATEEFVQIRKSYKQSAGLAETLEWLETSVLESSAG